MFERLENRKLMSVTASFASGVLTVSGDDHANAVLIGLNNHGEIFVHSDHHVILAVDAHHVTGIDVNLYAGNDSLETGAGVSAPMTIHGGAGNDTLVGGLGHDVVFGDDGDDFIRVREGHADVVDGGSGHDSAEVDHVDHVVNVEHIFYSDHHDHHHAHFSGLTTHELLRAILD